MATYEKGAVVDEKYISSASSSVDPIEVHDSSSASVKRPRFSWAVRQEESSFAATKNASNADFDPIPPSRRTWGWLAFVAYWMADA